MVQRNKSMFDMINKTYPKVISFNVFLKLVTKNNTKLLMS